MATCELFGERGLEFHPLPGDPRELDAGEEGGAGHGNTPRFLRVPAEHQRRLNTALAGRG